MNRQWVRIRSWHVLSFNGTLNHAEGLTLCGRVVLTGVNDTSDTLPSGKSCETCLRIAARQDDPA